MTHKRILIYRTRTGRKPFEEWLTSLRDQVGVTKIKARLDRLVLGNMGDHHTVGHGVTELRIHFGAGYRVYIGQRGEEIVVLLCGGDKSTQTNDIRQAHQYWTDYQMRLT
jgi:putative addiction module killer protein